MRLGGKCMVLALVTCLSTGYAGAQEKTVRPEIGKPVQAALAALKAKRGGEALAKAREAEAVAGRTPYETYVIVRVKAEAAAMVGESVTAAAAFEAAAASPAAPAAERLPLLAAAASQLYAAKSYGKAADLAGRYLRQGGADRSVRTLQIQSLYLGGDLVRAGMELQADIQATERAGKSPGEAQLQLLADIAGKAKDDLASFISAMEKLVAHYPRQEYWAALLHALATRPGFPSRLGLDMLRLKLATGALKSGGEYVEAVQLAMLEGFPAEARMFLDAGFSSRLLGAGAEADSHRRLAERVEGKLREEQRNPSRNLGQVLAGEPLFDAGFNQVLHGKADQGLAMMEQALKKGGFRRPEDARLRFGYACRLAGRKEKAELAFKAIPAAEPAAVLARLWLLRLGQEAK